MWNSSIQESENLVTGKGKSNAWNAYIKNISMVNYNRQGYMDSDMFKEKLFMLMKRKSKIQKEELAEDVVEMYKINKRTVLRF